MKKQFYSLAAVLTAILFWFSDAMIHYFIYGEAEFEFIPDDFNELWMRTTIIVLVIIFGLYVDYSSRKLLGKEKKLEATRIYNSMLYASQHIINNLLNQMLLFKLEAEKSQDFNPQIAELMETAVDEAQDLMTRLSSIDNLSHDGIWESIDPTSVKKSREQAD